MQDLPETLIGTFTLTVGPQHTADALGNAGMTVLGTPYVVWMVEAAAYQAIRAHLDPDEGVAGIHVDCYHIAPAAVGSVAVAEARLVGRDRGRLRFTFEVSGADARLAYGTYESMVLPWEKLRSKLQP